MRFLFFVFLSIFTLINQAVCTNYEIEDRDINLKTLNWKAESWKNDIMTQDGGTCASHAIVQAFSYVSLRNDWNPYWLHKKAQEDSGGKWDFYSGTYLKEAMKYMEKNCIYTFKDKPAEGKFSQVLKINQDADSIKDALRKHKLPVVLHVQKSNVHHAVIAYGYNDQSGEFKIKNSWGKGNPFPVTYNDKIHAAFIGFGNPVYQKDSYSFPNKYVKYYDEQVRLYGK